MAEITRSPLCWPDNVARTIPSRRGRPQFAEKSVSAALAELLAEINRLNGLRWNAHDSSVIVSSNLRLRQDGLPASGQTEPANTGVAVYFTLRFSRNGKPIAATRPNWGELDPALSPENVVGRGRGPVSSKPNVFGFWLKTFFERFGPDEWVETETVRAAALSMNKIVSESWWNKHSSEFLEKRNDGGKWLCRRKSPPSNTV